MSTSSELKSTIKRLRNEAGISQKQMASVVNLSQQAVAKWESGVAEPDTRALRVLADYFGVSVDYILGRQQEKKLAQNDAGALPDDERRLLSFFENLNPEGKEKLLDYADDLVRSGKYIKSGKAKMA